MIERFGVALVVEQRIDELEAALVVVRVGVDLAVEPVDDELGGCGGALRRGLTGSPDLSRTALEGQIAGYDSLAALEIVVGGIVVLEDVQVLLGFEVASVLDQQVD